MRGPGAGREAAIRAFGQLRLGDLSVGAKGPVAPIALVDEGGTLTYSSFSYDVAEHLRARRAVDERIIAALAD